MIGRAANSLGWRAGCIALLLALILTASAQDHAVSDNAVNSVAQKMYCPVCENIPLDECQTRACIDWKEEIRVQLAAGQSEQAVIESFVRRFGDQVVGVPQDPILRALTALVPLLSALLAIAVGIATFIRFGQHRQLTMAQESQPTAGATEEQYRQRLEEDLLARR